MFLVRVCCLLVLACLLVGNGVASGDTYSISLIKDIYPGATNSDPRLMVDMDGVLYFMATAPNFGHELWRSDGTATGTYMVKDIFPGTQSGTWSAAQTMVTWNHKLYFGAIPDIATSGELWCSDGTNGGTYMIKDINPYKDPSTPRGSYPTNFLPLNGSLYFVATHFQSGSELYRTDGTESGTVLVKDIYPGTSSSYGWLWATVGTTGYMVADTATYGRELWKTDGTESGTVLVKDICPGSAASWPNNFTPLGQNVLFCAAETSGAGANRQLWKSDGTQNGTVMVKRINPTGSAAPGELTPFNGSVYFQANDGTHGMELWRTDGTEQGTVLVKDLFPGSAGSYAYRFTEMNGKLYFFTGDEGSATSQLWATDGTEAGTVKITDLPVPAGFSGSAMRALTVGGTLIFTLEQYNNSTDDWYDELWVSDGTADGTEKLRTTCLNTDIYTICPLGDKVFFSGAFDAENAGLELYMLEVPEPNTLGLLAIGAIAMTRRRATTRQGKFRKN